MKNLIKNIRTKLELGNPERYVDGYYQLSKKQKWLWIGGLFLIGFGFAVFRYLTIGSSSSGAIVIISMTAMSFLLLIISLIPAFMWHWIDNRSRETLFCFKKQDLKEALKIGLNKRKVVMYQLWTVFLIISILAIFLKIPLHTILPLFPKFQ